jgi:hypothetical protein
MRPGHDRFELGSKLLSPQPGSRVQIQLQDVLAGVVGYGLAALFFRAFWPAIRLSPALGIPLVALYIWLGLAMSGPMVLVRRSPRRNSTSEPAADSSNPDVSSTWAELAWLMIGIYWMFLSAFVIPNRSHDFRFGDMVLFGLVPLAAALGCLFGPRPSRSRVQNPRWTHRVAVGLLLTWPAAWMCLIVLGRNLR